MTERTSEQSNTLAILISELKAEYDGAKSNEGPKNININDICLKPELFQPRKAEEYKRHTDELVKQYNLAKELDPLLVMKIGSKTYLVDGHHRLNAYKKAGHTGLVAVEYYLGSIEDAVLEAGKANSKVKLAMSTTEKTDFAWKLVRSDLYSKKRIREASCVADGTIATMRRVKSKLGDSADLYEQWWEARKQVLSENSMNRDDIEAWLQAQADIHTQKLSNACGAKLRENIELGARVIVQYFGHQIDELVHELNDLIHYEKEIYTEDF